MFLHFRRLIMYSWYLLLYVLYIILLLIFGSSVGLQFFRQNNYGALAVAVQEWRLQPW